MITNNQLEDIERVYHKVIKKVKYLLRSKKY